VKPPVRTEPHPELRPTAPGKLIQAKRSASALFWPFGPQRRSSAVLVVADLFQPLDDLPVELFLNGGVRHCRGWRSTMPMFFARREPDHISRMNLFNRTTLALHPTAAGRDNQRLTQRVSMPCSSGAGFECDTGASCAGRSVYLEQGIDAHRAGKPIGRSFSGWL
jgi:hypothetical protein